MIITVCSGTFLIVLIIALIGSSWLIIGVLVGTIPTIALLALLYRKGMITISANDKETIRYRKTPRSANKSTGVHLPSARRVGLAFLFVIIVLEIGSLVRWVSYPLIPTEMYGDLSWKFAGLESALFLSFGMLSPYFVVGIAFSFIYRYHVRKFFQRVYHALNGGASTLKELRPSTKSLEIESAADRIQIPREVSEHNSGNPVVSTYARHSTILSNRHMHFVIFSASLIFASLVAAYPHIPTINPAGSGVSTDEQYYARWMASLRADGSSSWNDWVSSLFTISKGDRPLTLLIILAIANITGLPELVVIRYLPVALAPCIVLATYVLLRLTLKSEDRDKTRLYSSIGAMLAAFSPQIIVGEYAGLLANWLALIPTYFAFYFVIEAWESRERKRVIRSCVALFSILIIIMLMHLYTWAHMLALIILFAAISFIFSRRATSSPGLKVAIMVAIVTASFSIDYMISAQYGTPGATGSDSSIVNHIQPESSAANWDRLFFTLIKFVGGFLSNPVLFALALVWILKANMLKGVDRLMISMCFMFAVPVTLGSIEFQTRILYNIPCHIFAVLALYRSNLIWVQCD